MAKICLISEEPFLSLRDPQWRGGRIFFSYAARFTNSFVITSNYKNRDSIEEIDGTKTYRVFEYRKGFFRRVVNSLFLFIKAIPILKKEKPEIIFAETSGCYFPAFLLSKLFKVKCKIHLASFPRYKYIKSFLIKLPYDEIIVTGEHLKQKIEYFSSAPIRVVKNGIDLSVFKSLVKNKCKRKLSLPLNCFLILYVGGFEKVKGLPLMIEIFEQFHKHHPNSKLFLVGEGEEKEKLQQLVKKKFLENEIIFRNPVPHSKLNLYYNAAEVLLLTSESEGGSPPRVVLEAMACNTPVISVRQEDYQYLQTLGIKTANNIKEYLEELQRIYADKGKKNLREKVKDFKIEKEIQAIFGNHC